MDLLSAMRADVKDKVVLITGASGGIGSGLAIEFARQGSLLVLTGRDLDKLNHTVALCELQGLASDKMLIVSGDVTQETDLDKIVEEAVKRFGRIDILINNAGIPMMGNLASLTVEKLDLVMEINCRSVFLLTQKVVPYLIQTKGCIVNVSSCAGIKANAGMTAYCMSKRCLDQMTKTLALELGPKGVRVNSVNPSTVEDNLIFTKGGMSEAVMPKISRSVSRCTPEKRDPTSITALAIRVTFSEEYYEMMKKNIPLGRMCSVADVAKATVFLSTNSASFVTGVVLPVEGGFRNKTGINRRANPLQAAKTSNIDKI